MEKSAPKPFCSVQGCFLPLLHPLQYILLGQKNSYIHSLGCTLTPAHAAVHSHAHTVMFIAVLFCTVHTYTLACTHVLSHVHTWCKFHVGGVFLDFGVLQRFISRCDLEPVKVLQRLHIFFTKRDASHIIQSCIAPVLSQS